MNDEILEDIKLILFLKERIRALKQKQALTSDQEKLKEIIEILSGYTQNIRYFEKHLENSILK